MAGRGVGVSRGPRSSLGPPPKRPPAVGRQWAPRGSPRPARGPSPTRGPVSPQSEDKYRCVSDSQCGPERFPSGGEWSPFPTPSQLQVVWDPRGVPSPGMGVTAVP